MTIAGIIESFRTEGRRAEVLPLGQLDAQYATKAIKLVLKNPDRPSSAPGAASDGKFQIEPDTAHNRLLVWATPTELTEVREFLKGLGETFSNGKATTQMHVVPLQGSDAAAVAQRLKQSMERHQQRPADHRAWPRQDRRPAASVPESPPKPADSCIGEQPETRADGRSGGCPARWFNSPHSFSRSRRRRLRRAQADARPGTSDRRRDIARSRHRRPGRRVIIVSRDPEAAEAAKQFIEQIVPAMADVQVISLKHAQAAQVKPQIDAMLAHTRIADFSPLNFEQPLIDRSRLADQPADVQHASPRQLQLINEIVPLLDQQEQGDERLVRKQQIYRAQRKRASEIALIVKEVYRDLLSTSDKVFDARPGYSTRLATIRPWRPAVKAPSTKACFRSASTTWATCSYFPPRSISWTK